MTLTEKQKTLELIGEKLLNHRPELEKIIVYFSDCSCSTRWCSHDLRKLAVLEEVFNLGKIEGLKEATRMVSE